MTTAVEIANQALGQARARAQIADLSQNTPEANQINQNYDSVLTRLLRRHDWSFARRTVQLALLKQSKSGVPWDPTQPKLPWLYAYAEPNDCIRVLSVVTQGQYLSQGIYVPHEFYLESVNNNFQRAIGTNGINAMLNYTAKVTNPDLWTVDFTNVMIAELGAEVVIPLSGDVKLAGALSKMAADMLTEAMISDGNAESRIQDIAPDWLVAREDNSWL